MGKRKNPWRRKVRVDLTAIALNLKPGYMWDECKISPEEARTFLVEVLEGLSGNKIAIRKDLNILTIKEVVFTVCLDSIIENIDSLSPELFFSFHKLEDTQLAQAKLTLKSLRESFVQFKKDLTSQPQIFHLETQPNWSLTFVWGVILGFPVILIHTESDPKIVPELQNHKVYLKIDNTLSDKVNINCFVPFQHLLYSFSYPFSYVNKFRSIVDKWYDNLISKNNGTTLNLSMYATNEPNSVVVF